MATSVVIPLDKVSRIDDRIEAILGECNTEDYTSMAVISPAVVMTEDYTSIDTPNLFGDWLFKNKYKRYKLNTNVFITMIDGRIELNIECNNQQPNK